MSTSKLVRQRIWSKLKDVARPDTRFHLNFAEVIPDFDGSEAATDRLVGLDAYRSCRYAFITPDNCLVDLRRRLIEAEVPFVMSTYGIYRGFLMIEPGMVPKGAELYAAWLDGMEHFARPVTLQEVAARGRFDFLVTGASAVSVDGVRFGKGHGFFDLEWAVLYELGVVDARTPIAAFVHDCQIVDVDLDVSAFDTICDYVVTPTQMIAIPNAHKPTQGILWDQLKPGMIDEISWLQEMQALKQA